MNISNEKMEQLKKDYQIIVDKNHNVGEESITPLMKEVVAQVYGEDDLSTSGYWVRVAEIIKQNNNQSLLNSIHLVSGLVNKKNSR